MPLPYDTTALLKQSQAMLDQTKAEGEKSFAGSSYDINNIAKANAESASALKAQQASASVTNPSGAVVSNEDIIQKTIPNLNGRLATAQDKGSYMDETGTTRFADGSLSKTPEQLAKETELGTAQADVDASRQALKDLKAQVDATSARLIDSITQQYDILKKQQAQANTKAESGRMQSLLVSGAAQYGVGQADSMMQEQISYGISKVAALDAEENQLIAQAQQAQQESNYKILDKLMTQAETVRKEKHDELIKLNEKTAEMAKDLQEKNIQASRDSAIADLISQGITNPAEVLNYLNYDDKGNLIGDFSMKEVTDTLNSGLAESRKEYKENSDLLKSISESAMSAGQSELASQITMMNPGSATFRQDLASLQSQITDPTVKLDIAIKQAQLEKIRKENTLLGEPTEKEKEEEAQKLKTKEGQDDVLKEKVALIDSLLISPGIKARVGPNILSRKSGGFFGGIKNIITGTGLLSETTGTGQQFSGGVHKLASREFLDTLIDSKKQGATFGSLTDREGDALRAAATQLNDWEVKDDKGMGTGVWNIDEKSFKKELENLKRLAQKGITNSGDSSLPDDESSVLDSLLNDTTEQDVSAYFN